jgi:hypothetical protein
MIKRVIIKRVIGKSEEEVSVANEIINTRYIYRIWPLKGNGDFTYIRYKDDSPYGGFTDWKLKENFYELARKLGI